jgi:hypothetical protein
MSDFYDKEKGRAEQAREDFGAYGLEFLASQIDGYTTDGHLLWKTFCLAVIEFKPELCLGNADPLFEAAWYYVALTRDHLQGNLGSHLPCLILYAAGKFPLCISLCVLIIYVVLIAGAHIGFAGAIWTDRPHLQVLAPTLPLFYHASDVDMRIQTARCLAATKRAINALKKYYEDELPYLNTLLPPQHPNLAFPHQSQYVCLTDGTIQPFKYVSHLQEDKLVFSGVAGNVKICIKFVRQYSKEAHLRCSSLGFAPRLRGFQQIPGGWYMVVMDFIDDMYHDLSNSFVKASFQPEVEEKVIGLHQEGFVHGDLRDTNIMVKRNGTPGIMLVDFDWAGVIGEVRYPMNVNNVDIKRPDGAHDNELIMTQHDIRMIDFMFEQRLH